MFQVNTYVENTLINCSRAMSHEEAVQLQEECYAIRSALWGNGDISNHVRRSIFFKIEPAI